MTLTDPDTYAMLSCPPDSFDVLDGHYEEALRAVQEATRSKSELLLVGSGTRLTYEPLITNR